MPFVVLFLFWSVGGLWGLGFGGVFYCLRITRDHRLRHHYSAATAHLDRADLVAGYRVNMAIVADYLQNKPRPLWSARKADAALIMATVLREHIAAQDGLFPAPTYLQSRRELWRKARTWNASA